MHVSQSVQTQTEDHEENQNVDVSSYIPNVPTMTENKRVLIIGLTVGSPFGGDQSMYNTALCKSNREGEDAFQKFFGNDVRIYGIDLQLQFWKDKSFLRRGFSDPSAVPEAETYNI